MSYRHLSFEDRRIIHKLRDQGKSLRFIASVIGVSHSTVSRELGRKIQPQDYCPESAHKHSRDARNRANAARSKLKRHHTTFIREQLGQTLSPEQIASLFPDRFGFSISPRAIYSHIYKTDAMTGSNPSMRSHLRLRGKARRKKWHLYHGTFCARPNISLRPEAANTREKYGHWEMDLFVGSRGQKASALVLVERKSRYSLIRRLPDQSQRSVLDALGDLAPKLLIKSITTDNGSEFLNHETLARLVGAPVFYCNPYHAWEKGTVENTIGLYREFFKKGERMPDNLNLFSRAQHLINSRPRKVLGFRTATSLLDNIIS